MYSVCTTTSRSTEANCLEISMTRLLESTPLAPQLARQRIGSVGVTEPKKDDRQQKIQNLRLDILKPLLGVAQSRPKHRGTKYAREEEEDGSSPSGTSYLLAFVPCKQCLLEPTSRTLGPNYYMCIATRNVERVLFRATFLERSKREKKIKPRVLRNTRDTVYCQPSPTLAGRETNTALDVRAHREASRRFSTRAYRAKANRPPPTDSVLSSVSHTHVDLCNALHPISRCSYCCPWLNCSLTARQGALVRERVRPLTEAVEREGRRRRGRRRRGGCGSLTEGRARGGVQGWRLGGRRCRSQRWRWCRV